MKAGDKSYRNAELFAEFAGPLLPAEAALEPSKIHEYVEYLTDERGVSGSTVNRHLSAISRLAKVAVSLRLIDQRPELPWQKAGEGRIRWFTHEEEEAILKTLQGWGQMDAHDLFIFLADTGARLGEAAKLRWKTCRKTAGW